MSNPLHFPLRAYNPLDWYWLAADGRLFSSARAELVAEDDAAFAAWAEHGAPTVWPRNEAGEQTTAALQAVLAPHGLYVDLAELKASLKRRIDDAAEAERLKYITPGAGQAMTYARKVEQAKAVLAATDPQPEAYPMLAASIGIDGDDLVEVATTIVAMDAAWEVIGGAIEAARLAAKRAVDFAEDAQAARAVAPVWPQPI